MAALHGLRGSARDWFRLAPPLRRELQRSGTSASALRLLTLPGHRPAAGPPERVDRWTFLALHREVERQLDRIADLRCVVGHSWGARFALEYAAERPERSLVVVLIAPYFERSQLGGPGLWASSHPRGAAALQWALGRLRLPSLPLVRSALFEEYEAYAHEGRPAREFLAEDQERASPGVFMAFADTPDFAPRARLQACGRSPAGPRFLLFWSLDDRVLAPCSYPVLEGSLRASGVLLGSIVSRAGGHNPQIHRPEEVARGIARHL